MINHVRTLLLNRAYIDPVHPAEYIIDPHFTPAELPSRLVGVRDVLLTPTADKVLAHIRANAAVEVLKMSSFASATGWWDPRVAVPDRARPVIATYVVKQSGGPPTALDVTGKAVSAEEAGNRSEHTFQITANIDSPRTVSVLPNPGSGQEVIDFPSEDSAGAPVPVPLAGTGLSFTISQPANVVCHWYVSVTLRTDFNTAEIAAQLKKLPAAQLAQLFEPLRTKHPDVFAARYSRDPIDLVAAHLVAYVYGADALLD